MQHPDPGGDDEKVKEAFGHDVEPIRRYRSARRAFLEQESEDADQRLCSRTGGLLDQLGTRVDELFHQE